MMETSPQIGAISGALAKAQAGLGVLLASKDVKNKDGTVRYTYANLADALSACRETLNANGIAVVQSPATTARNGVEVTTMLVHESGEWIKSDPLFMPVQGGAQDVGSGTTYARRYSLLAMVGLPPKDDDGEAAQAAAPSDWGQRGSQRQATQRSAPPPDLPATEAQVEAIETLMHTIGRAEDTALERVWVGLLDTCTGKRPDANEAQYLTTGEGGRMLLAAQSWAKTIADEASS